MLVENFSGTRYAACRICFTCSVFHGQDNEVSEAESGSDPPSDEAEDLDEEEYEELRPAKRPRHGGFIIEEAGELCLEFF